MNNSKVRTSPVTEAFVRFHFTGICSLVTDSSHSPLVAVIPDGRQARYSSTDPSSQIPSHHAFVMFPAAAASGREADFIVKNGELGVCLLENELLSLAGGTIEPVAANGSADEIIRMSNVCSHATMANECIAHPPHERVLAQVNLPSNALWVQTLSEDEYTFDPPCSSVSEPMSGKLAEVAALDLRITDASTLMLVSHPFSGASRAALVLSLEGTSAEAPLVITIGNVPLPDLQRYVNEEEGHHHHDRDVHFELYYTLTPGSAPLPLTVPARQLTKVPHASNCPVAIMDVEG
ncbi:MAG TPA: hypothetical protein VJ901_18800 [Thermoanaerobaculia bacterium]|nr:hypothetical protein [Thermoanaerobaculia bacterium]